MFSLVSCVNAAAKNVHTKYVTRVASRAKEATTNNNYRAIQQQQQHRRETRIKWSLRPGIQIPHVQHVRSHEAQPQHQQQQHHPGTLQCLATQCVPITFRHHIPLYNVRIMWRSVNILKLKTGFKRWGELQLFTSCLTRHSTYIYR